MRILLVSPYDLGTAGGVTSHILDFAQQLRSTGHEATVVGPARTGVPANRFTHYIGGTFRLPSPGDNAFINLNPLVTRRINEFLMGREFDVIHVHEPFLAFIGPTFLRQNGALKVGTFHATRSGPHVPYALFRPFISRWSELLDGRIAVSETAKRTVCQYFPGGYTTIPNGINFDRFAVGDSPAVEREPTILFVGRLEERKGIRYLLDAFARLKPRLPRVRLVIVGDGLHRQSYERYAARLGLRDVDFAGFVHPKDLPSYYRKATVVCQPSTCNESFGITVLEAMAAGTPVVATDIPGFSDLIQPNVTGLAVAPKNAEALGQALESIFCEPLFGGRLAAAAQELASLFDWSTVAARVLAYYQECRERTPAGTFRTETLAFRPSA